MEELKPTDIISMTVYQFEHDYISRIAYEETNKALIEAQYDLSVAKAVNARLWEAGKKLLTASEMRREFEVNSSEDFNEMYPDPDGWAHGDVDENWLVAMDAMRAALTDGKS